MIPDDEFDDVEDADAEFEAVATNALAIPQDDLDDAERQRLLNDPAQQLIVLPEGASVGEAIFTLNRSVPQNEFGLPAFFYRSDLLPSLSQLTQASADAAVVYLSYENGYPEYNGRLFWGQLPHEPMDLFMLFQRYIAQVEEVGLRQLELLAMDNKVSFDKVLGWSKEYYWSSRARAYDLFHIAADRKRKEALARKTERTHFDVAGQLLAKFQQHMEDSDFLTEFFKGASPAEIANFLRQMVNIQRISVGLAANGNAGKDVVNPDGAMSPGQLIKSISEGVGIEDDSLGLGEGNLLKLLSDPSFAFEAQKLVVRVHHQDAMQESTKAPKAIADDF